MTIVAAADGSSLGNPGPAGWAWYIDDDRWAAGGWPRGTNNLGELTAVLELLRATAASGADLEIYCDSQYVINTITKWMKGWKAKGWRKKDGRPPENLQVVRDLDAAMAGRTVRFTWVKGHAGHELNEAADRRAQAAAAAYQAGRSPDRGPGLGTAPRGAAPREPPTPVLFDELDPLADPVDEVVQLERELLTDDTRTDAGRLAELLHPGWREITSTGQVLTRHDLLLDGLPPTDETLDVLDSHLVGSEQVQVITRRTGSAGSVLRSSWWVLYQDRWRLLFQQTTPQP